MNNSFSIQHSSAFNKVMAYTSRDTGDFLTSGQKKALALVIIFLVLVLPALGFLGLPLYNKLTSETPTDGGNTGTSDHSPTSSSDTNSASPAAYKADIVPVYNSSVSAPLVMPDRDCVVGTTSSGEINIDCVPADLSPQALQLYSPTDKLTATDHALAASGKPVIAGTIEESDQPTAAFVGAIDRESSTQTVKIYPGHENPAIQIVPTSEQIYALMQSINTTPDSALVKIGQWALKFPGVKNCCLYAGDSGILVSCNKNGNTEITKLDIYRYTQWKEGYPGTMPTCPVFSEESGTLFLPFQSGNTTGIRAVETAFGNILSSHFLESSAGTIDPTALMRTTQGVTLGSLIEGLGTVLTDLAYDPDSNLFTVLKNTGFMDFSAIRGGQATEGSLTILSQAQLIKFNPEQIPNSWRKGLGIEELPDAISATLDPNPPTGTPLPDDITDTNIASESRTVSSANTTSSLDIVWSPLPPSTPTWLAALYATLGLGGTLLVLGGGIALTITITATGIKITKKRLNTKHEAERAQQIAAFENRILPDITDRITITERLASGGGGTIDLAKYQRAPGIIETVVVKVPHDSREATQEAQVEAQVTTNLGLGRFPNTLYPYGLIKKPSETGGVTKHGIVIPFMPGGTLVDFIEKQKLVPLNPQTIFTLLTIASQLAKTLTLIHEPNPSLNHPGIVHRDLKSDNILFDSDGNPQLADFGSAAKVGSNVGTILSLGYASPEVLLGQQEKASTASDVYSYGVVLWEIMTGTKAAITTQQFRQNRHRQPPQKIPTTWTSGPNQNTWIHHYTDLIAACLRTNPLHRPTMAQILTELSLIQKEAADPSKNTYNPLRPIPGAHMMRHTSMVPNPLLSPIELKPIHPEQQV